MTAYVIELKKTKVLRTSHPVPLREADHIVFECDPELESDVLRLQCEGREPIMLQVRDGQAEAFATELLVVAEVKLWSVWALVRAQVAEEPETGAHYRARGGGSDRWILCAEIPIGQHSKSSLVGRARTFIGLIPCLCLVPLALQHGKLSAGIKLTAASIVLVALTAQLFAILRSERIRQSVAYKSYMVVSAALVILGLNALLTRTVTVRTHTHSQALVERFGDESVLFFSELNDAMPDIALGGAHLVAPHQLHQCLRHVNESTWTPQEQAIECENRWTTANSQMHEALGIIPSPDASDPACVDLAPQLCGLVHEASQDLSVAMGPTLRLRYNPTVSTQQGSVDPVVWQPAATGTTRISLTDERLRSTDVDSVRRIQVQVFGAIDLTEIRLTDAPASRWVLQTTTRPKTGTALSIAFLKPTPPRGDVQRAYDDSRRGLHFELSFRDHDPIDVRCEDSADKIQVFEFYSADASVSVGSAEDRSTNARQLMARCVSPDYRNLQIGLTVSSTMLDGFRGAPFNWQAIQQLRFPAETGSINVSTTFVGHGANTEVGGSGCPSSTHQKRILIFDFRPILTWRDRRGAVDLEAVGGLLGPSGRRVSSPAVDRVQYGVLCVDADTEHATSPDVPLPISLGIDIHYARLRHEFGAEYECAPAEPGSWSHLWSIYPPGGSSNDSADHVARLEWFGPRRARPSRSSFRCWRWGEQFHLSTPAARRQSERLVL